MTAFFVTAASASTTSAAPVTPVPNNGMGWTAGDRLIAWGVSRNGNALAPPTGWTQLAHPTSDTWLWSKIVPASEAGAGKGKYSFSGIAGAGGYSVVINAYRGLHPTTWYGGLAGSSTSAGTGGSGISVDDATLTPTAAGAILLCFWSGKTRNTTAGIAYPPSGMTQRGAAGSSAGVAISADQHVAPNVATGTRTVEMIIDGAVTPRGAAVWLKPVNSIPTTPVLDGPADDIELDVLDDHTFSWTFADPDFGDEQTGYRWQYRSSQRIGYRLGATGGALYEDWHNVAATTDDEFHELVAGTLDIGSYDWRVATLDLAGAQGPWSVIRSFSLVAVVDPPIIDLPRLNEMLGTATPTVSWTVTDEDQEKYQVRRTSEDGLTSYYDSGAVVSTSARTAGLGTATVDSRWESVGVRVFRDGSWSPWATQRVYLAFDHPAEPTLVVTEHEADGYVDVAITNPGGGDAATDHNDLYHREVGLADTELRVAQDVAAGATVRDYFLRSGVAYEWQARAVADNGQYTASDWVS